VRRPSAITPSTLDGGLIVEPGVTARTSGHRWDGLGITGTVHEEGERRQDSERTGRG